MPSRTQLASLGPDVALRESAIALVAAGAQPGTITYHANGSPVPVYPTEFSTTPDVSGAFITDIFGRVPGWIDNPATPTQVDIHIPPADPVTYLLSAPPASSVASNGGDAITGHSASTQANAANASRCMLAYFNLDPAAVIYGVIGAGPAVLNRGFVIYPAGDWNTPRDTGGIVWQGSIYLISTIDAIAIARVEV